MKPVKLFYLKNCPFCKKALRYIEEARAAHPELAAVGIEMIEESEQPALADTFDYYYVPTCRRREGARRRGLSRGGGEDFTLGTGITLRSGDPIRGSDSYEPAR